MWKNWFSAYRSDDEPGSTRDPADDEYSPEDRGRRKKVIAAILAGVALLLLVLLLCLVLLLTTNESKPEKKSSSEDNSLLKSRKMGKLGRNVGRTAVTERKPQVTCLQSPPLPRNVVSSWDKKTRAEGTIIIYWCKHDPDEEQILVVICSDRVWKEIYRKLVTCDKLLEKKKCLGDPIPPTEHYPFDWDFTSRNVGTNISYKCNPNADAPVMRWLICGKDYEWHVHKELTGNCYCGNPLKYSPPIKSVVENWDGKFYKPGATVKYSCKTSMGETHFQTLVCLSNSTWVVTKTGSCYKSLNYTNSVNYCNEMGGQLVAIKNEAEQDAIRSLLSEEKSFDSTCIHKAFLGIQEDVTRQWQTGDGKFVSGISDMFFMVDEGSEKCAAVQRPGYFKLNNVQCTGTSFCQICEYEQNSTKPGCSNPNNTCYIPNTMLGDYEFSVKECEDDDGILAEISNINQLDQIRDMLSKDAHYSEKCNSGFYINLKSDKRYYTTPENEEVNFTKFVDDNHRSMNRHCVVIHELQRYMWIDEDCSLSSCFICKMAGFPIGTITPKNMEYIPATPSMDSVAAHLIHDPLREVAACDPGWVTDGFHCYLFNDSLVTNAEARSICRNNFGSLASLVNSFERNFILDHLMNRSNDTDSKINSNPSEATSWFVESTGGLPSDSDDDIGYPTNLGGGVTQCVSVHVTPSVGWSVTDCDEKAGFVCHD